MASLSQMLHNLADQVAVQLRQKKLSPHILLYHHIMSTMIQTAAGGALGGLVGWMTSGQFKSVPQILVELPAVERQKLCTEAMAVVKNLNWTDAAQLIALVMANSTLTEKVIGVLTTYLKNELQAQIKYGE
uniref:Chromosome 19 open reading frame 12 n=1 Tax=Ficedula albicollis TaxID=59894 RepID=A0A803VA63_FICAL